MDQVNQQSNPSLSSEIEVNQKDKSYIAYLKTVEGRVEISFINQEESHLKWQVSYSVDESFEIHKSFFLHENLKGVFEYFENLIKKSIKNISFRENNMVIEFEVDLFGKKFQFSIQLVQCEYNTKQVIASLSEQNVNLKRQLINQHELEQIIKDQSQLAQHEKYIERQQMKLQEKEALKMLSKIIKPKEFSIIKAWISDIQVDLNLIYRATRDGFEIEKIHEKCRDKNRVILLIKTMLGQRFGFYSDLEIKSYGGYQAQNPNNIFIFSLNQKQKYTSNDSNCQYAFYSNINCLILGASGDIFLLTNSNSNNKCYVQSNNYGRNQGLIEYSLNGGNKHFQTTEVEIFEIRDI